MVIPVKNGADTLAECLEGVFSQKIDCDLEVLAVDSGSTDASLDILGAFPVRVLSIPPEDFSHGDTRNLGAAETDGDLIAFTVQDALPADGMWLHNLVRNLVRDERAAGAFSRIVPRPTCGPLVERGVKGDLNFGSERIEMSYPDGNAPDDWDPLTHRIRANFNDVSSVVRRSAWERIPFQRTPFGEDIVWSDSALRAGYKIIFDPESVVIHSHEYRPASIYPRTHIDGWFNRAYFNRLCIERLHHVLVMTKREFKEDLVFLKEKGLPLSRRVREGLTSLAYHFMEYLGFYLGTQTRGRICPVAPAESRFLKILLPVSERTAEDDRGMGPVVEWAGCLRDMGHEVAFIRAGRVAAREAWQGFPLYRADEGTIDGILGEVGPDLLHCQDASEFTAPFLLACKERGIPCLFTMNDLFFRCPRGDLIKGDGTYCSPVRPPGLGCASCLKDNLDFIYPFSLIDRMMGTRTAGEGCAAHPRRWAALLREADFVIAPSPFIKAKCREAGMNGDRVVHIPRAGGSARWEKLKDLLSLEEEGSAERCARELVVKYRQAVAVRAWENSASRGDTT